MKHSQHLRARSTSLPVPTAGRHQLVSRVWGERQCTRSYLAVCLEMECPGLGDDVERKRVRLTTVRNGDLGSFNRQRAGGSVLQPSVSRPRKVFVIPELAISYDTPPGFGRREADTRRRRRATTKLTGASSRG